MPAEQEYEADALVLANARHGPELCLGMVFLSMPPQAGGLPITNWFWDGVPGVESRAGTMWASVHVVGTYDGESFTLTRPATAPLAAPLAATQRTAIRDFAPACPSPTVIDPSAGATEFRTTGTGDIPGFVTLWVTDSPEGDAPFVVSVIVRPGHAEAAERSIRQQWKGRLCVVERDLPTESQLREEQERLVGIIRGQLLRASANAERGVLQAHVIIVDEALQATVDREFGTGRVELTGALQPLK